MMRPDLIRAEIARRRAEQDREALENRAEVVRQRCINNFGNFVREAWPNVVRGEPLIWNWHLDAISEHFQAVSDGQINRLLVNMPPGTMKSLMGSVFFQAWEWGPQGRPSLEYLSTSYKSDYVERDTRKTRDLIISPWYQLHWPMKLPRKGETSFANEHGGFREGQMFSSLTSGRGNRLSIDDPHSTESAESDADRERALRILRESVPTRLNDLKRDAIYIMMQRLHTRDVSGEILAKNLGYVHLLLPMEFEPERKFVNSIGWTDPRTQDGELLFPTKFPRDEVEKLKTSLGSFGTAGQLQQSPVPRGGGMFKREWFAETVLRAMPGKIIARTRAYDRAATQKKQGNNPSFTAAVRMSRDSSGRFIVEHVWRCQETAGKVRARMKLTAETDPKQTRIIIPKEPAQAGKDQTESTIKAFAGYDIRAVPMTGDKETRADPFSIQCEAGNVYILSIEGENDWVEPFLEELCTFPMGAHNDQVDAASDAFNDLALRARYTLDNL